MVNKDTAVKSILAMLKKGMSRKDIMHDIAQQCTKDGSTLRRWFSVAQDQYNDFMAVAEPIIKAKEIQALGEIAVSNILSKTEAQYILSQIAKGKVNIKKDAISRNGIEKLSNKPSAAERVNAIDKLAKMNGWNIVEEDHTDEIQEIKVIRIASNQ